MPFGQLVDEAELAVVVARADPVEHRARAPRRRAARRRASATSSVELEAAAARRRARRRPRRSSSCHSMTSRGTLAVEAQHLVAGREPGRARPANRARRRRRGGRTWPVQAIGGPPRRRSRAVRDGERDVADDRRAGAARRAAGLLRRRRDGDQGAGVDGAQLRAARVLLPRDRPQPARRRALRAPGRGVRRRHRRGARRAADHAVGPRLGARGGRRGPRRGSYVVDSVCPLVTKVHHEVQGARRQGLPHRLRRPRGPRGGGRHDGRRARRDQPGRVGRRGRRAARRSTSPSRCSPRRRCRTATGAASPSPSASASPTCGRPGAATCASRPPTASRR